MKNRKSLNNAIGFEKFGEKCGVIAVWSSEKLAPLYIRKGLAALQHRGQESAGISIFSHNKITTYSGMGLVPNVLTGDVLVKLGESNAGIGHNRYSTSGSTGGCNAQPITVNKGEFGLSIGHNGNIPDLEFLGEQIKNNLEDDESSDTNLVANLLLQERPKHPNWDEVFMQVMPRIHGAFCFVILTSDGTLYAIRDPHGIRPQCLGKSHDGWVIASESVALDVLGAEFLRDVKPGEIIKITPEGRLTSSFFGEPKRPQHCIFEYIYFSRPDSFENGIRVRKARENSGRLLGERILKKRIEADLVVPVFDSGYPAAKGVSQALGLPMVDAITVSHYTGRTFIQPGQQNRMQAVNGKHNIVPDEIIGKRIIVVDDSAVRLTTSKRLRQGLQDAGAKEVYMVFASPPVVNQCDMGIDMRSKKELPASEWEKEGFEVIEKNVARLMGANGVVYLPMDETAHATGGDKEDFYHFPFGGPHPLRNSQPVFSKRKKKLGNKPKIAVFISGKGANLQAIIDQIENEELNVEIATVISNKENAYGLERAKKRNIPTHVLPFTGKITDKQKRAEYDSLLLQHIKKTGVDLIVLAGWMLLLGDEFLNEVTKLEIPVLNLHPAILTAGPEDHVATSRGTIPVIRGAHAVEEAFRRRLHVSGVTVHQVMPQNYVDIGPIILSEEVRIIADDTIESFESRMHEAEHRVLPTALKRVLHVMRHGIDISKGKFYW